MKLAKKFRPQVELRSFGSGLIVGCFLVSTTYVMMSKTMISMEHLSILNCLPSSSSIDVTPMSSMVEKNKRIQLSEYESATRETKPTRSDAIEMHGNSSSAESAAEVPFEEENVSSTKNGSGDQQYGKEEEERISRLCESSSGNCKPENDREVLETLTTGDSSDSDGAPERKPMCDFSDHRSDVCDMEGDIRVIGKNLSSVMLVTPSDHKGSRDRNESWQIRPYPRKFDDSAMAKVRALNLTSPHGDREAPRCTVNHAVPGVLFSTGGHSGNCFHDFADVLIPLFQTAGPFQGQVQFIIADRQGWWMHKYRPYLMKLSSHDIIDYDNDDRVHCFKHVVVGLRAERDLMIDPAGAPEGFSIMDFVRLTRSAYSLERDRAWAAAGEPPGKKPRLLLIARGGTRRFMNLEEVVGMAEGVGYEVVASEPDFFDVGRFARVVNSCDVMVGVHGAGLTNFVFLPTDAIVIQVVPLGKLDWIATNFYAEPAMGMKLRYLQYDISVEESTLKEAYPRDHQVFKDPESIHKQGWFKLRDIYLKRQNVELDVNRFRPVLQRAFKLLREKKYS